MTQILVSSNDVIHNPVEIDNREGTAEAACGYEGEPVDADDVEDGELCSKCYTTEESGETEDTDE